MTLHANQSLQQWLFKIKIFGFFFLLRSLPAHQFVIGSQCYSTTKNLGWKKKLLLPEKFIVKCCERMHIYC